MSKRKVLTLEDRVKVVEFSKVKSARKMMMVMRVLRFVQPMMLRGTFVNSGSTVCIVAMLA
jgi:DNA topoisomerase VI subunit A